MASRSTVSLFRSRRSSIDLNEFTNLDLSFNNVSCTVSQGFPFCKTEKTILHEINGEFRSGELTAILGPSGAGKSTLLNILAGYLTESSATGQIRVNGKPRCLKSFHHFCCYIMQDDHLNPHLTVRETMMVAANLKLDSSHTTTTKEVKVSKIVESIGLMKSADTRASQLSGGERKKLAIALELLSNPPIMFLDEPTSGLDSSSSKQVISLLSDLAKQGRTIVCTLHQPSATIMYFVDHLFCLVEGRCAYSGSPTAVTIFLATLDFHCPSYHNPADFLIEVCSGEYGDHVDELIRAMDNGNNSQWRKHVGYIEFAMPSILKESNLPSVLNIDPQECEKSKASVMSNYPVPFYRQVFILVKRTFLTLSRDQFLLHARLLMHIATGLLIGGFYLNIGSDAAFVFENFSLLFFNLIFLVFSALSAMIISFPAEVLVIKRETFNRWYSVKAYYLSACISEIPVQFLCALLYSVIVYWMTSQPRDAYRFCLFLAMCITSSLLAQSMGYLIGASMKVQNGVIFGPLSIMPWVILSGYFLHIKDSPWWLRWMFKFSYLRYGLEGLMITIYGYGRPQIPCSIDYCHFNSPSKFLREMEMDKTQFWQNILIILGFMTISKIITYIILKFKLSGQKVVQG